MHRLFRTSNLFIVAVTQYLLQYLVLAPAMQQADLQVSLDHFHFFLLVLTTVLIAAGGYVINDVLDYETDLINKRERVTVEVLISKNQATAVYALLTLAGAVIAWYLAGYVGQRGLFSIYPAAVLLLFWYSFTLKKLPLAGNVTVALFCAGVAGIVLFAERKAVAGLMVADPLLARKINWVSFAYVVFAFISTLLRELIKDMEDIEGDRAGRLKTLPIAFGMDTARQVTAFVGWGMLAAMGFGLYWLFEEREFPGLIFSVAGIVIPLTYILFQLKKSHQIAHFSRLSRATKLVMLSGLLLLIILWKF